MTKRVARISPDAFNEWIAKQFIQMPDLILTLEEFEGMREEFCDKAMRRWTAQAQRQANRRTRQWI
jgi:hypothetical protein